MGRDLTSGQAQAANASHVSAALLIEMQFASGTIYVTTAARREPRLTVPRHVARGGNVESIREAATNEATGLRFTLAGPIGAYLSAALSEHVQGKPVKVYVALFDANDNIIDGAVEEWGGLTDTMTVEEGGGDTSTIIVSAESRYAQFARPKISRHNDADQQAVYAGDLFYKYAPGMVERSLVWPNREWFKRNG